MNIVGQNSRPHLSYTEFAYHRLGNQHVKFIFLSENWVLSCADRLPIFISLVWLEWEFNRSTPYSTIKLSVGS